MARAFEELAEIAEPFDPRRQRVLHFRRELLHFQARNPAAHTACSPLLCVNGIAKSTAADGLRRTISNPMAAAATTSSGAAIAQSVCCSGVFAAINQPTTIGPSTADMRPIPVA